MRRAQITIRLFIFVVVFAVVAAGDAVAADRDAVYGYRWMVSDIEGGKIAPPWRRNLSALDFADHPSVAVDRVTISGHSVPCRHDREDHHKYEEPDRDLGASHRSYLASAGDHPPPVN